MKTIVPFLFLFAMPIAKAQQMDENPIADDRTEDQQAIDQKKMDDFQAGLQAFRTDPIYAGSTFNLTFKGVAYTVDRSRETRVGNPPSRQELISGILGAIGVNVRADIHFQMKTEYYQDGSIKSETITIDAGGSWQAQTGMEDAAGKSHK